MEHITAKEALSQLRNMATQSVPNCVNLDAIDRVLAQVWPPVIRPYKVGDKFYTADQPHLVFTITAISTDIVDWSSPSGTLSCCSIPAFDKWIDTRHWLIVPKVGPGARPWHEVLSVRPDASAWEVAEAFRQAATQCKGDGEMALLNEARFTAMLRGNTLTGQSDL